MIAVANRKGGVAKTTTTISLGTALAARGHRVLLVDLDAQQDLCAALQVPMPRPGLADALTSMAYFQTADLAQAFVQKHGVTVAGGYGIAKAEKELALHGDAALALKGALAPHLRRFDFVLIDCAPSIGSLTTNALAAASEVVVPIQTEFLAANQLPGIMSTIDEIRSKLNPTLRVAGFLPTLFDARSRHALSVLEHVALQAHMWGVRAFKPIPATVRLPEASKAGEPVRVYAPRSRAAVAYEALASELELIARLPVMPSAADRWVAAPGAREVYAH